MIDATKSVGAKVRSRRWYLPHVTTLLLVALVATPLVLSNLVEEEEFAYIDTSFPGCRKAAIGGASGVNYRSLARNIAVWFGILATTAIVGEVVRRRFLPRLQWSVRSMVLLVGCIYVFLAWCNVLRQRADRQDPVIAQLESMGAGPYVDRWGPRWLNVLGADRYRRAMVGVTLAEVDSKVLADAMKLLAALPSLRRLDLGDRILEDAHCRILGKLAALEELSLTPYTHAEHDNLGALVNLRVLRLGYGVTNDRDLEKLAQLERLEELYLRFTEVRGDGLEHLARLTRLHTLDLSGCPMRSIRALGNLKALTRLDLAGTYAC